MTTVSMRAPTMVEKGTTKYEDRCRHEPNRLSLFMFGLLNTGLLCGEVYNFVSHSSIQSTHILMWFGALLAVALRLVTVLGTWIVWLYKVPTWSWTESTVSCGFVRLSFIQLAALIVPTASSSSFALRAILELYGTECVEKYEYFNGYCGSHGGHYKAISPILLLCLLCSPLTPKLIFRALELHTNMTPWILSGVILLLWLIDTSSLSVGYTFIGYICVGTMILCDNYDQYNDLSGHSSRVQSFPDGTATDNESHSQEMRAMIGNVAHDLKTPLTSFTSGIECLHDLVNSCEDVMRQLYINTSGRIGNTSAKMAAEKFSTMRNCLNGMLSTSSFMLMTINRCLDYAKVSKGFVLKPKFETIDFYATLQFPLDIMKDVQSKVEICLIPNEDRRICSHLITDKQWLIENVLCLLSNAAKYSNGGTVELGFDFVSSSNLPPSYSSSNSPTKVNSSGHHIKVWVRDTGIGLSDHAMQQLFNPFQQAQRLAGGTGLGLFSLAKRTEALRGHYGVNRRDDSKQGSVFWFTIPYRPDELSTNEEHILIGANAARLGPTSSATTPRGDGHQIMPTLNIEGATVNLRSSFQPSNFPALQNVAEYSCSVLVVDDAPLILKMITMLLTRKGHLVFTANNGADALEKLDYDAGMNSGECPYDIVLMDLQMPVMDGIEAIKRVRQRESELKTEYLSQQVDGEKGEHEHDKPIFHQFIVALSANSDHQTMQEALQAGADTFIAKPFTYETFLDILKAKLSLQS